MVTEFHGFTRITKPSPVEEYENMVATLAAIERTGRYSLESLALMHWAFMMFISLVANNNPLVKDKLKYFSCTELVELAACINHPEAVAEYFSPLRRGNLGGELDYFLMHAQQDPELDSIQLFTYLANGIVSKCPHADQETYRKLKEQIQYPKADHQFQIKEDLRFDIEQRFKVLKQIRDYLWCKSARATGSLVSL